MSLRVLGPLEARGADGPLALKGPRQRALLARLLVAGGRVVSLDGLVAALWPEWPPEGAVGAIRTFVADLRRALEPDRPPRGPARLLVTAAPGYALRMDPDALDARRFETAAGAGADLLGAGRSRAALDSLEQALALWRGPAYAEFAEESWARGEADRLEQLRLLAMERRAQALIGLDRAGEAAAELHEHVRAHPLRENAWHTLALALYRAGRQGDALEALRRARHRLAEDLGLDPGARLRALEADILAQAPGLGADAPPPAGPVRGPAPLRQPSAATSGAPARPFVGRTAELHALEDAAAAAAEGSRVVPVLIAGGAGQGKTALARALFRRLAEGGWATAWGDSPEHDGAPAVWAVERIAADLGAAGAPPATARSHPRRAEGSAAEPTPAARFSAQREGVALVAAAAEHGPVVLVADDLHRAAEETLDLLTAVAAEPLERPVLLVGAYRGDAIGPALAAALARLARREPVRLYLDGLSEEAVGELVACVAGRAADAATVGAIRRRSGGNPFYVRELARVFAEEGASALDAVPAGVGDVVRHRLAGLDDATRRLLRQAAVIGSEVETDVLAAVAGGGEAGLEAVEAAVEAGVLTQPDPRRLLFAHALLRDAVYAGVSGARRAHWHTAAAEAIQRLRPDDAASLAHHFARSAAPGADARAAHYGRVAAQRAEERFAPHEAARLWEETVAAYGRAGIGDERARLEAVMGLVRALAVTGRLADARNRRAEAVADAERLGDPELTARIVTAFDVPAVWPRNDDEDLSGRIAATCERTLAALPAHHEQLRARLLAALALELRGDTGPRGARAAREAEQTARRLADPALLAQALNAGFMQSFHRAGGARGRAAVGAELVELAAAEGLVAYEVLGRLVLLQAHAAMADFAEADRHAAAAQRLGERHEIGHVEVFIRWYGALRQAVSGSFEEAEAACRAAGARLAGTGMPGLQEGIVPLALLCLRLQTGRPAAAEEGADWGPYAPWAAALIRAEGSSRADVPPQAPVGLLDEALTCLRAHAAMAAGDREAMRHCYEHLLPAADELAGAGSGLLTLGPVAHCLGDLADALGRRGDAAEHYRHAARVADRARAPHWSDAAQAALARTA
ncbi:Transcriptional regulatory protein EmbR [Streptomonospora litoralis]|uniref:Transcriptional regulatory protein EmbR n=1 Tax=Streptomonospora litoralis TaxID=2498135 RepID=A0A4P6Q1H8_9ACTN|nr:Transcriptional regulatory protein EmbR [Streptomonospora litoralis]